MIHSSNETNFFNKGGNAACAGPQGESAGVHGNLFTGAVFLASFVYAQLANFFQGEVDGVVLTVLAIAARKNVLHVGSGSQIDIMQHDCSAIFGQNNILLQKVCTHCMGEGFTGQGMFRQISTRPAMSDDDGLWFAR